VVYPCISYSRPLGRLRETGMRLDPIWNAAATSAVQSEIWAGDCPQCWTACEAYQSILGNVLAGRTGTRVSSDPVHPSAIEALPAGPRPLAAGASGSEPAR
jgi:hypothetical protein